MKARQDLRKVVWEQMDRYPDCPWVLTSRVAGYSDVLFHTDKQPGPPAETLTHGIEAHPEDDRARVRYVAPFDDPRIDEFARK